MGKAGRFAEGSKNESRPGGRDFVVMLDPNIEGSQDGTSKGWVDMKYPEETWNSQ